MDSLRRLVRLIYPRPVDRVRRAVARRYLSGEGLEIGALHNPLHLPRSARVRYVDRMDTAGLRLHYPELARIVPVSVVDDGETLATVADASQDFVIASHLLEHCEDPIGALGTWLRVVRPGGIVWLAVPDKRHTFDRDRPCTSLAHLIRDHAEGPSWSRSDHYAEYCRFCDPGADPVTAERNGYSIHFHVWTDRELLELLLYCRSVLPPFTIELFQRNAHENLVALRRDYSP